MKLNSVIWKMVAAFIVIDLVLIFAVSMIMLVAAGQVAPVQPRYIQMEATKYCHGTVTASGAKVREGIAAAKKEWIGLTAAVYLDEVKDGAHVPGEFVGYFEILDTGGSRKIKGGTCIDIYDPDYDSCIKWGRKNVWVVLVKGAG